MYNIAIIVAAGSGLRMKDATKELPKQYLSLNNGTINPSIFEISITKFLIHKNINYVIPVISQNHEEHYTNILEYLSKRCTNEEYTKLLPHVYGGNTRSESVFNALKTLASKHKISKDSNILIHDSVRPFVNDAIITNVISKLDIYDAIDVGIPLVDTIKLKSNDKIASLNRNNVYSTQTPQGFKLHLILKLHENLAKNKNYKDITDDITLCLNANIPIYVVNGHTYNFKITLHEDLNYARFLYQNIYELIVKYQCIL